MSDILLRLEDMCIRTPERALVDGVSFTLCRGKVTVWWTFRLGKKLDACSNRC